MCKVAEAKKALRGDTAAPPFVGGDGGEDCASAILALAAARGRSLGASWVVFRGSLVAPCLVLGVLGGFLGGTVGCEKQKKT